MGMKIKPNANDTIDIEFGELTPTQEVDAGLAIIDIDRRGTPVQVELVRIFHRLQRISLVVIAMPSVSVLGNDVNAVSYDQKVDCMIIRMFPNQQKLTPFRNREVPLTVFADRSGTLCGVRILVTPVEVNAISLRMQKARDS